MKIAITGSTGFVGSYAVNHFSKNHNIIAFNRNKEEVNSNIKYKIWDINHKYIGNEDFDIFIHCASDTQIEKNKKEMIQNNVSTNKNILELVNSSNCKHFIYISSSSVYQGLSGIITSNLDIDKSNLLNSYSYSKFLAEEYLTKNLNKTINITILRPRAIYGKGDRVLVPKIIENQFFGRLLLPGNGKNITSITEINHFIETIEDVITQEKYGIYNSFTKINSYENLYEQIIIDYRLKGIIKVPMILFKILSFFNKNKYSYIIDTFSNDKILK